MLSSKNSSLFQTTCLKLAFIKPMIIKQWFKQEILWNPYLEQMDFKPQDVVNKAEQIFKSFFVCVLWIFLMWLLVSLGVSGVFIYGLSGTPIILKQRIWGFKNLFSMASKQDIFALTVIQMPGLALITDQWAAGSWLVNPFNNQIHASTGLCQTCWGRASSLRLCKIRVCLIYICLLLCMLKDTRWYIF